jgi:hypothetical protein
MTKNMSATPYIIQINEVSIIICFSMLVVFIACFCSQLKLYI